jgi:type IV secretory pathway VirD2 relaxase
VKKSAAAGIRDRGVASSLERPAFRVRIGTARPAAGAGRPAAKLSSRIRALVMKQGAGRGLRGGGKRFSTGRGGRAAAQFAARSGRQRVTIKARIVRGRPGGQSGGAIRAHLRYIRTRDETTLGRGGELFNGEREMGREQVAELAARMEGDRHHFRFIVSAEHGDQLDLKAYTREVVANMEKDLGTKLEWVAGQHHDTDNPHVHLMIRGKDDRGGDLVINRGYISHGMREQAAEVATRHLGPRLAEEIERTRQRELRVDRPTGIDFQLAAEAQARQFDERISLWQRADGSAVGERERLSKVARLHHLESLGLARERAGGEWSVDPQLLAKLRRLSTRGDLIKLMHGRLPGQASMQPAILNKDEFMSASILGRVVDRGVSDELYDRHHLLIEASDGKTYYVPLGAYSERPGQEAAVGSVVTITQVVKAQTLGAADRNIATQALRHDGIYDPAAHEAQVTEERKPLPPGASPADYVESHDNRAKALASRGVIEALPDGTYRIPVDLPEQIAKAYAQAPGRDPGNILQVERHSAGDFAAQESTRGLTWLDREILRRRRPADPDRPDAAPIRRADSRFERDVRRAIEARQRALRAFGIDALDRPEGSGRAHEFLDQLYALETEDAARRLRSQYGEFERLPAAGTRRGTVAAIEELPSGPHVVLVLGERFTLVPASATLARQIGKHIEVTLKPSPQRNPLQPRQIDVVLEYRVIALKRSRGLAR